MTTLASVPTNYLGQFGYLAQRVEERSGEDGPTRFALGRVVAEGFEFVDLTEGATQGAGPGGYRIFHFTLSFPCRLTLYPRANWPLSVPSPKPQVGTIRTERGPA